MIVKIPTVTEHEGYPGYIGYYKIADTCPVCGAKRGIKRWKGLSYDGSRRLSVDCWHNKCDHVDKYPDVRKEGIRVSSGEYEIEQTTINEVNNKIND